MFVDAAQFLLRTAFDLLACALFLRFWMQWVRVPFHNPFAQFVLRVTDFAVRPLRRLIPGFFGLDWASLIPFYVAELLSVLGSYWLMDYPFATAGAAVLPAFLLLALAATFRLALYLLMGFVLLQAILSWVNPFSPHAALVYALARPVLKPFQRLVPPIGGVDLTPMVALIVVQLLLIAPVSALERLARTLV
ncbi:MAG: YggT family protein [Pseudomonadota bacterium]|nr:YggT family protein [Pseudomonadota bacterium]MDP1904628.1 YggT family protein [Pseudomonadota bacterium]MDP2353273.1 YggT family protein [Pseudomonadota bacterium]